MATWDEVMRAAPDIATLARERIEATGLALVATLRRDGFPRVSGVEPMFHGRHLWLGMMPGSRKSADLRRDPRLCLHNATVDKEVTEGDVKVTGRAVLVADEAAKSSIRDAVKALTGFDPGTDFDLYQVDVVEVATVRPNAARDRLVIESWREGESPRRVERA